MIKYFTIFSIHRLEKEKQLVKSEVDEAKSQTETVTKAKVSVLNFSSYNYIK